MSVQHAPDCLYAPAPLVLVCVLSGVLGYAVPFGWFWGLACAALLECLAHASCRCAERIPR